MKSKINMFKLSPEEQKLFGMTDTADYEQFVKDEFIIPGKTGKPNLNYQKLKRYCNSFLMIDYFYYEGRFPFLNKVTAILYYYLIKHNKLIPARYFDSKLEEYEIKFYREIIPMDFVALVNFAINIYPNISDEFTMTYENPGDKTITKTMIINKLTTSIGKILLVIPKPEEKFAVTVDGVSTKVHNKFTEIIKTNYNTVAEFAEACRAAIFNKYIEHNIIYGTLQNHAKKLPNHPSTYDYLISKKMIPLRINNDGTLHKETISNFLLTYSQVHNWNSPKLLTPYTTKDGKQKNPQKNKVMLIIGDIKDMYNKLPAPDAYEELYKKFNSELSTELFDKRYGTDDIIFLDSLHIMLESMLPLFKFYIIHCKKSKIDFMSKKIKLPHFINDDINSDPFIKKYLCFQSLDLATIYFYIKLNMRVIFPELLDTSPIQRNIIVSRYNKILPIYSGNCITNIKKYENIINPSRGNNRGHGRGRGRGRGRG